MDFIDVTAIQPEPIQDHSSKGDQPKWHIGNDWYKQDYMGYESLSEILISCLLRKSNIAHFIQYDPIYIQYQGETTSGCISKNFRNDNEMLIPFERLHRSYEGIGLAAQIAQIESLEERISYTVNFIEDVTRLTNVGVYLTTLLELDAFFLNEDRHTNNLAVLRNEKDGSFRLCPIFDNGLALLSDLHDYPLSLDVYDLIDKVHAKPFDADFEEQLFAAEKLYGKQLKFTFTRKDVHDILISLQEYYDARILHRIENIIYEQMRKYTLFF